MPDGNVVSAGNAESGRLVRYQNLDLWVERSADGRYLIQGKSPQGDAREHASVELGWVGIDPATLGEGRLDAADLRQVGDRLFTFLFRTGDRTPDEGAAPGDPKLGALFDQSLGAARGAESGLRIRLKLDEANPEIAAMPWEYLFRTIDDRFLATQLETPVVRFVEVLVPLRRMETTLPLAMLMVVPAAADLQTELEVALVEDALGPMQKAVNLTVLQGIVTPDRLERALLERNYDVLHFVGHGDFDGARATLHLNDAAARPLPVDQEALGKLLRNQMSLKLVVLNSCRGAALSDTQAFLGMAPRLVAAGVPAVVAMQYPIRDDEALCFVQAFYGALFTSKGQGSIDFAISTARDTLERRAVAPVDPSVPPLRAGAVGLPTLFMRYEQGVLFRAVTGNPLRDVPFRQEDAARDKAVIEELDGNRRRLDAAAAEALADPDAQARLADQAEELDRIRRRLRYRNASVVGAVTVALVTALAFAIGLLDRLPLTWVAAASPVWFGDPVGRSLEAGPIAIVTGQGIDPTWRGRHAALVDRLSEAGARVVVLDIFFHEPRPADDAELAAAFGRARERGTAVVIGVRELAGNLPRVVPALAETTIPASVCLGENRARFSGIVPLIWASADGGLTLPSLSLAAVAAWRRARIVSDLDAALVTLVDPAGVAVDRIPATRMIQVAETYPGCSMVSAGSRYGEMLAARAPVGVWRDPARRIDYPTVLAAAPADLGWARDKIVLVGSITADELSRRTIGLGTDERYGVERHADAIATMLSDAEARPLGGMGHFGVILVGAVVGAAVGFHTHRGRGGRAAALLIAAVVGFGIFATITYRTGRILVDVLYPSAALILAYLAVFLLRRRWLP